MDRWQQVGFSSVFRTLLIVCSLIVINPATISAQAATAGPSSPLASLGLPELNVTITDTGVQAPAVAAAGLTYVKLNNETDSIADATFFVQPDGVSLKKIASDLQQEEATPDWVYATAWAGGPVAPAAGAGAAVIDLSAGDWIIALTSTELTSVQPAALTVTGESASATSGAVPSDLAVTMKGYTYDFPDEVAAGPQVWEVTNEDPVPHFAVLQRYPGPVTTQDVEALLTADDGTSPANLAIDPSKFEDGGFIPIHTQGKISWLEVNLTPGTYVVLCFMTDQGSPAPHAMMGMYDIFTVPGDLATPSS